MSQRVQAILWSDVEFMEEMAFLTWQAHDPNAPVVIMELECISLDSLAGHYD